MRAAQSNEKPAAPPSDLGVVDVMAALEKCKHLQAAMKEHHAAKAAFEAVARDEEQQQKDARTQLEMFAKGTNAYDELAVKLAKRQAVWNVEAKAQREDLQRAEAGIYAKFNTRLEKVITDLAAARKLRIAVRFSREALNEKDRTNVLRYVNRPVIFQDRLDITEDVIAALNSDDRGE